MEQLCVTILYPLINTRFSERVAVTEVEARRLLKLFAEKGLSFEEVSKMKRILESVYQVSFL